MIRDRAWRRHIEEIFVVRRLKNISQNSYWRFSDVNEIEHQHPKVIYYLGKKEYFQSKTISTDNYSSRYKCKYSPNSTKPYWRDKKVGKQSFGLREKDKANLLKLLREYGIK